MADERDVVERPAQTAADIDRLQGMSKRLRERAQLTPGISYQRERYAESSRLQDEADALNRVCNALAQAQQEIKRLLMVSCDPVAAEHQRNVGAEQAEALTRTLARALDDADGGMEAERRRQKVLGDPRVQALLKENTP